VAVRAPLFAALPDAERAGILDGQFTARRADRARRFPAAVERVILDGTRAVGAVTSVPEADAVLILDLAIVPGARGRGIGTAAVEAVAGSRAARVEVELTNPGARRFYARLGFTEGQSDGVTVTLHRAAGPATD
jgi:ribosomal protein S18 acetylase RimI-like enzyme